MKKSIHFLARWVPCAFSAVGMITFAMLGWVQYQRSAKRLEITEVREVVGGTCSLKGCSEVRGWWELHQANKVSYFETVCARWAGGSCLVYTTGTKYATGTGSVQIAKRYMDGSAECDYPYANYNEGTPDTQPTWFGTSLACNASCSGTPPC